MKPITSSPLALICIAVLSVASLSRAILVQPHNFAPDEHDQETSGFLFDHDLLKLGQRLRDARMMQADPETAEPPEEHFSQEMADLIHREHQHQMEKAADPEPSLSASVAHVLMNVARAAAANDDVQAAAQASEEQQQQQQQAAAASESQNGNGQQPPMEAMSSRGSILEMDTSGSSSASSSQMPSKSDLKQSGPKQWFNPKETIPVLKISSMATPSKYKKVYFRAEKKLVDGAFHSLPTNEKDERRSLMKSSSSFNSNVQRRSSRGTSSSVPPGILQDGVIDFLKKFRDVYIQTRPVNTASGSSSLASTFLASAASSPLASFLAPPSSGGSSRPNLASAISAATSMMSSAAQVAQAASAPSSGAPTSGSSGATAAGGAAAAAAAAAATGNSGKGPLTAQSYVSFWSKTFPTWVRKVLKQMRRRSLHNSSKRQQHQHHSGASHIGQAAANVASAVEQSSSGGSSSSGSSKQT